MAKLLSSLPVGAKVKDTGTSYNGKPILFTVMEHGHSGDPAGTTALVTSNIITLKCFDSKESGNSDANRQSYGNNRYLYSNLKQWLNSSASGAWYTSQHSTDAPPTNANVYSNYNEYDQEKGFLANFSENLRNELQSVTKRTAKNTVTDGGGYEDVSSKIFLLSTTEVGLANENNVAEGSIYSFFNTSSNRIAYPTAEAVSNSEYKESGLDDSKPWYWWIRTPSSGNSYYARCVHTDGSRDSNYAFDGSYGVRPACVIPSSISVSDTADTDGAYTIVWNSAPKISTDSTDLGDKNIPFSIEFSMTDDDGDAMSASVSIDGEIVENIESVNPGEKYKYTISGAALNAMTIGAHEIKIDAKDSFENESSVSIVFNKTMSPVTITGSDGDKGNIWMNPSYIYQVDDTTEGATVNVVEAMDGEATREMTDVQLATDIQVDFSAFEQLSDEEKHTLTITAEDSNGAVAIRTITFTKLADRIEFYLDAVETDEAAKKIIVEVNRSTEGNPEIKVEVTNNAMAISPVWENSTEEFNNKEIYNFTNKPTEDFGVSVKVTLTKNENTERIYVDSMGFSFY